MMPASNKSVDVIIPTGNIDTLTQCLFSIRQTTGVNYKVVVCCSHDERDSFTGVDCNMLSYKKEKHFNYAEINNLAVQSSTAEYLCFLNDDTKVISPDWLFEMAKLASDRRIGCVGAKLYYPDDTIQHAGVIMGLRGIADHSHKYFPRDASGYMGKLKSLQCYSAVTGACMVVRREVIEEVGGFDEIHLPLTFNDVDLCLRVMEAGYLNVWTPFAELYHYESKTRGRDTGSEQKKRARREADYMRKRWKRYIDNDPFYPSFLTRKKYDFSPKYSNKIIHYCAEKIWHYRHKDIPDASVLFQAEHLGEC